MFNEKTGRAVARSTREYVLTHFWASHVKDEFDLIIAIQTKAEFSCAIAVKDKIQGWEEEECGSIPKPSCATDRDTCKLSESTKFRSILEPVNCVCHDALDDQGLRNDHSAAGNKSCRL